MTHNRSLIRNTMRLSSMSSHDQGLRVFQWVLLFMAALFSCFEAAIQCSATMNDVSYVPNIPASLTELGSTFTELSIGNVIYLYPVSSLVCSGTVTGVEFCYRRVSSSGTIFTLLIFSVSGNVLRVDNEIPIPTPSQQECSGMTCCSTYTFTNEQFELPQDDFHLGVQSPNSGNQIIGFHSSQVQYSISGYITSTAVLSNSMISNLPAVNNVSLRVMRLIVDSSPATDPTTQPVTVPTTQPVTDPPHTTTQGATTTQPTTPTTDPTNPTVPTTATGPTGTTDPTQTTDSPTTPETTHPTEGTVTTPSSPTNTGTTSAPQTADDGIIVPTVVGVLVAVLAVLLLVTIVVIVACVCKQKRTRHVVVTDGNLAMDQRNESFGYTTSSAVEGARDYETVDTDAVTADTANITVNHETPMYETLSDTPAGVTTFQNPAYRCVPNAGAVSQDYGYVNEGMGGLAEMTRCEAYGTVQNQQ